MRLRTPIRVGLAAKLALCLVASTAAFLGFFGYENLRAQRRHSEETVVQAADRITDVIRRSSRYEMMHNDREALYNVIREIGAEPGIARIRIFNKDGRVSFSTDAREVGQVVDKRAEACYGCHAQQAPLTRLARPDRARIFAGPNGQRLLGVIRPIDNEPTCSDAACHAHPPGQRVLGVIDANLSLAAVDEQSVEFQRSLTLFTIWGMVLVSVGSVVFIWAVVYRPVKELIGGTRRVAGGDLAYRLPVRSEDELGDLARSFNRMTERVEAAHAQIEERVRMKTAELEEAHKSLLASEKLASIGKLAATVAHEVNNPLFGILTYARLTRKALEKGQGGREEMMEQLRTIERESRRCGELMRNLLTFARQTPSHREPNELKTLVERAEVLARHSAELQRVELVTQLDPAAPPAYCDANQIQQVILVLMVNAVEAMAHGGRLEVSTGFDAATNQPWLRVKDNGPGIPPELISRIFEPFFTTKEDQQRTGLGLAVARSIVEQHGGEIAVHSVPGQGTEFRVTLPVAAPAAEAGGIRAVQASPAARG